MDEQRIKTLFPRASRSFYQINSGLRSGEPEYAPRPPLVDPAQGKAESDARISVSYVLYRIKLLDPDNAVGATKVCTDCLCEVGILPGDAANQIELSVTQEKVNHRNEQRTVVTVRYP